MKYDGAKICWKIKVGDQDVGIKIL